MESVSKRIKGTESQGIECQASDNCFPPRNDMYRRRRDCSPKTGPDRMRRLTLVLVCVFLVLSFAGINRDHVTNSFTARPHHVSRRDLASSWKNLHNASRGSGACYEVLDGDPECPDKGNITYNLCSNLTISKKSIKDFHKWVGAENMKFISFRINFVNINVSCDRYMFFPFEWIWTYRGMERSAFNMLKFPFDFDLLSLGLLGRQVKRWKPHCKQPEKCNVSIDIVADPGQTGCSLALGYIDSDIIMQNTLQQLINHTHYSESSMFCYEGLEQNISPFWRYVSHFLGMERNYIYQRCCPKPSPSNPSCNKVVQKTSYLIVIQVYGALIAMFSPLLIGLIPDRRTRNRRDTEGGMSFSYSTIDDNDPDSSAEKWVYLSENPLTVGSTLKRLLCVDSTNPILRRGWRVFFVLLSLSVAIIRTTIYNVFKRRNVAYRLTRGVPVGQLCIPFGLKDCMENTCYFMGGPLIWIPLYFVVASILICIPDSVPRLYLMLRELSNDERDEPITWLHVTDGKLLELRIVRSNDRRTGYSYVAWKLKERFIMLLGCKFWRYFFSISWIPRFRSVNYIRICLNNTNCSLPGKCAVVACAFLPTVVAMLFLTICCVTEMALIILCYGFPMCYFVKLTICGLVGLVFRTFRVNDQTATRCRRNCGNFLSWSVAFLMLVSTIYALTAAIYLFIESFTFIMQISAFTFVGIVVYPQLTATYTIAVVAVLYYLTKCLGGITTGYTKLLHMVIDVSVYLQKIEWRPFCENTDELAYHPQLVRPSSDGLSHGVPWEVYDHVVENIRPLRVQIFSAIVKLFITGNIIYSTVSMTQSFHQGDSVNLTTRILAVVFVGLLPEVLGIFSSQFQKRMDEEAMEKLVERLVMQYWQDRCGWDSVLI